MRIEIFDSAEEAALHTALIFKQQAFKNIAEKGRFNIALSGGSTPLSAFAILKQKAFADEISWSDIFFFWGDERYVAMDSLENNSHMARQVLLDHVPVPEKNIFTVNTALSPADAAIDYEKKIRQHFDSEPFCFDLILLGIGTEGHTASLFPHSPLLKEQNRLVKEIYVQSKHQNRISFTLPLINAAHMITFLVCGKEKADITGKILNADGADENIPATSIRPVNGNLLWILDKAAAANI